MNLELIRKIAAGLEKNKVSPRTVKTQQEAREMTANDPCGRVWREGEEYFLFVEKGGQFVIEP